MKKSYEFSSIGYAQFLHDCKSRKQKKINILVSTGILIGCVIAGVLSKELLLIYGVNTGVNMIMDYIV